MDDGNDRKEGEEAHQVRAGDHHQGAGSPSRERATEVARAERDCREGAEQDAGRWHRDLAADGRVPEARAGRRSEARL
ncbi:MAG: hypothetical protein ACRDGV_01535 [Candidatus Limnocylindria bacterium]